MVKRPHFPPTPFFTCFPPFEVVKWCTGAPWWAKGGKQHLSVSPFMHLGGQKVESVVSRSPSSHLAQQGVRKVKMGTTTHHTEMKKDDFSMYVHLYTVKYNYTIMYMILKCHCYPQWVSCVTQWQTSIPH